LLKKSSNINQKTPPIFTFARNGRSERVTKRHGNFMVLFPSLRPINIVWQFGILRNGILNYKYMPRAIYKEEHQKIVERLKQARFDAGLAQVEVAEKLGRTQSYVSKIESGQRRFDVLQLKEFAKLYKKPLDFFVK
ncbi:MAG: helix-turn-helix transcriptional regulator, partial [Candidatus Paceibacterota bacterium]